MTSMNVKSFANKSSSSGLSQNYADKSGLNVTIFDKHNAENLPNKDFELIKELLQATYSDKINWKQQSFLKDIKELFLNKEYNIAFRGWHKGNRLFIEGSATGKVRLTIRKWYSLKPFIDIYTDKNDLSNEFANSQGIKSSTLTRLYKSVQNKTHARLVSFSLQAEKSI